MTNGAEEIIASDEARELVELFGEPFTMEWRLAHAITGDAAMSKASEVILRFGEGSRDDDVAVAAILSSLAQVASAHYAAANVRAKPGWLKVDDAPRPAPADKSWLKTRRQGDRACFACGQTGGSHVQDCAGVERVRLPAHGWPVEETPAGRVITLPAGVEVSAKELVSLGAVGIEVRWAEPSGECRD